LIRLSESGVTQKGLSGLAAPGDRGRSDGHDAANTG
jgi:hypothetical protein